MDFDPKIAEATVLLYPAREAPVGPRVPVVTVKKKPPLDDQSNATTRRAGSDHFRGT